MHTLSAARAAIVATLAIPMALVAQDSARAPAAPAPASRGALPLTPTRTLRFTTDEGTWMSLDVSPDGRTIVFDLVGDLYTLPIAGGTATRITDGMGFDAQPRWSPDGRTILFTSDRSGGENLWLADADGRNPRPLTKGDKGQYISPDWSPDGEYIGVSRSTTDVRASTYELYLYHRDGGTGLKLAGASGAGSSAPQSGGAAPFDNYLGAAFGPDPRFVWTTIKRGGFGYNLQFPLWQVAVYDRETGRTHTRSNAWGSGMRPTLSPDGQWLVYATRADSVTSLRIRELAMGDERWLARGVQRDDQESRYTRDNMPGMSFTPDSRSLVLAFGGKIWRIDAATGRRAQIPFSADVDLALGPVVKFAVPLDDTTMVVRQIRGARPSPDGRRLAFTALDKVWTMDLAGGTPRRLTSAAPGSGGEHAPVWSPDGRWIAFVGWREEGGDLWRVRADGKGRPEKLTRQTAFYANVNYTPDGTKLVAVRGPRQPRVEETGGYGQELIWIPATGGSPTVVAPVSSAAFPHFTRDGSRIYLYAGNDGLQSMRFDGTDVRTHVKVTGFVPPGGGPNVQPASASDVVIAPDGGRAVAIVGDNVYLLTVPVSSAAGITVSALTPATASVPMRRVTRVGGDFPGWSADGRQFHFSLGHSFFRYDIARAASAIRDSASRADSAARAGRDSVARRDSLARSDSLARVAGTPPRPAYEPERLDIVIRVRRDRPGGTVVLRNARIITMKGDEIIEKGDVLVRDNRIVAVGASGTVDVPSGAHPIDVTGKTIMPGLVDVHAHLRPSFGIHKTQPWEYLANLAYGVTTTRDPQTGTTDVLSYGDLVETGEVLGPRIFSTGPGVFWSEDIKSLEDARDVLRRYADFYDTRTIKQYGVGDRKVRQWIIMAARELGLMPTSENYLDFKKNLTEAIDGYPGAEHSYPISPLYKDAVQVIAQSGITYTPTFLVDFGGPSGEEYFYGRYDITKEGKLARFMPRTQILQRALRRDGRFHDSQFAFIDQAAQAAKIVAAGGRVGLGGHGQLQGLGDHWELWAIGSGGMKPHDVLRVGTIFGADAIGLAGSIGSIEPGKLADLLVLDANPLDDIHNTNTIRHVMKNGRIYDAATLDEIWPRQRRLARPRWWDQDTAPATDVH